MSRAGVTILVVAVLVGAGLGSHATGGGGLLSPLLRAARPGVVDVHGEKGHAKLACGKCHPGAKTSAWASDDLIPRMPLCGECHPVAAQATVFTAPTEECGACHIGVDEGARPGRGDYPRPDLRFSHRAHDGIGCAACHPGSAAGEPTGPGRDAVGMRKCYDCHRRKGMGLAECRTCHLVLEDGRMDTKIRGQILTPPSWLAGMSHGADWVQSHAPVAGARSEMCAACHRETDCQDCHAGRLRRKNVHPGDWMSAHGVSTRMDNPRCMGCHRTQSFCITCHRRAGVAPDSPSAARPPGAGAFHGSAGPEKICRRAKRDITACVSCHSESSCIRCHATINPHPPGFSRRCKPLALKNQSACVKCHGNDSIWRRCR